jgi:hypothetical protein
MASFAAKTRLVVVTTFKPVLVSTVSVKRIRVIWGLVVLSPLASSGFPNARPRHPALHIPY